jgi:hypothetical protein
VKDSSLAVSLGLAAIDGLTCAFIAILILALILIGVGSSPGAHDADPAQILMVHVAGDGGSRLGIDLRLLVDVSVEGDFQHTAAFTVESAGSVAKLDALGEYAPGGGVWWKDCQTLSTNECFAEMFVTKAKRGGPVWRIRFRVADSGDSFTTGGGLYKLWLKLDSGPMIEGLSLTPDQPIVACVNWSAKTALAPCP